MPKLNPTSVDFQNRVHEAIKMGIEYGDTDGGHHKMWVIGQMLRILTGCPTEKRKAKDCNGKSYEFELHEYVVECPYVVGSRAWMSIADRDEQGCVVLVGTSTKLLRPAERERKVMVPHFLTTRRVLFPRFQEEDLEDGLEGRIAAVYKAATERGFDNVGPDQGAWKVVHVEYRCTDGVEHVLCGLPLEWDSRLALGVSVMGQIG